jgi:Flp pilus assembly protein TadG
MFRAVSRSRAVRHLARFLAAREAATAVEFALVSPFFFAMLIAIFQVGAFVFAQQALQNAAMQAGRLFMTGQAQANTQSGFKTLVCQNYLPTALFNCNSLVVIVQTYSNFASANTSAPAMYNSSGQPITTWAYTPGTPGQVMVVELVYPWSVLGGPLGFNISNLPNSAREMLGITAFRVEPYSS